VGSFESDEKVVAISISDLSTIKRTFPFFTLSSSRTGCYFFPSAGKGTQKSQSGLRTKSLNTKQSSFYSHRNMK